MSRCGALDGRQTLASLEMCLRSLYIETNVSQQHQYSLRATLGIARSDMLRYKKSSVPGIGASCCQAMRTHARRLHAAALVHCSEQQQQ